MKCRYVQELDSARLVGQPDIIPIFGKVEVWRGGLGAA